MGKVTDKGDNLPPCFCLTSANWHVIYSRMSGGFFSSITALILTQTVLPIQEKNLPKSLFFFKAKRLNIHTTETISSLYSGCLSFINTHWSFKKLSDFFYYFLCHHCMSSLSLSIFMAPFHYYENTNI